MSGGEGTGKSMRDFVAAHGVPPTRIIVESRSRSTRENALFTRDVLRELPPGPRTLLTSDYHLFRAARVFRKAGIDVHPCYVPDGLKFSQSLRERPYVAMTLVEELLRIVAYAAKGWM
jgi:uncharacterized SAM-binding protein YcdF (DUF218 family)